jgi:hypothetical protein
MPRPPRDNSSATPLSHGQSHYVLERMIAERRISPGEVARYVSEMGREISDLEQRLQRLREAHGGSGGGAAAPAPARRGPGRPAGSGRGPGRPAGSGRGPGRPAGSGRGPGRPPGSGRGPGRPAGSGAKAGAGAGASSAQSAPAQSGGASTAKAGGAKRGRKRSSITPEQLASRQLQGRYLALVRQFAENRRASFAKIAKERGREAAIREMQDSLKK